MEYVKLIHWKVEEVPEREAILQSAGFHVDSDIDAGSKILKTLAEDPPEAIIIDLSRLPSQGRDFALMIRKRKGTRLIPLIFVGGEQAKVEKIRNLLPDAEYTTWEQVVSTLASAVLHPPKNPVVHESTFAGYSGKSLAVKLGIKQGMQVALINSPPDFVQELGKLPEGVQIVFEISTRSDLAIWFCLSVEELLRQIESIVSQSHVNPVWIAWPKQTSALASDLTQQVVRQTGLQHDLVDYKISAYNDTWSGLLFKYREK